MGKNAGDIGAFALGGAPGLLGKKVFDEGKKGSTATSTSTIDLGPQTALGRIADRNTKSDYINFRSLLATGNSNTQVRSNVRQAQGAQNDLAFLLKQYRDAGGAPLQDDITNAQNFSSQIFNPQQVALQQSFDQQRIMANRQAGISGRGMNDPILRNKLAQSQALQQGQLQAQQGAFAAQFAQGLGQQRLGLAQDFSNLRQGIASQALQNRQAMLQLGSQMQASERNFRLATASRTNTQHSGGGFLGGVGAVLGTVGGIASIASAFRGGGGQTPQLPQQQQSTASVPMYTPQQPNFTQGREPL